MGDIKNKKVHYFWAGLRIAIGLIFLWAFFDKLLGLGLSTCLNAETNSVNFLCDSAWVNGGSPTTGFLKFVAKGPFVSFHQSLADSPTVDWIFMMGLLGIGLTLTFGFLIRIGSIAGAIMLFLMWTAVLPPEHHPFLDNHIIYIIILLGFVFIHPCKRFGLGRIWGKLSFVKRHKILE